jgi:hypothetical protein
MQTQSSPIERLRQAVKDSQLTQRRERSQTVDTLRRVARENQTKPLPTTFRELASNSK